MPMSFIISIIREPLRGRWALQVRRGGAIIRRPDLDQAFLAPGDALKAAARFIEHSLTLEHDPQLAK